MAHYQALQIIEEMKEFAGFSAATQRYIRRSLDIALGRRSAADLWARDEHEASSIAAQVRAYDALKDIREALPGERTPIVPEKMLGKLISVAAFDLSQGRLESFAAYRFLYERLLGPQVRPWLPAAFCAAAAMPSLHPLMRRSLLRSISESAATAPGWSSSPPAFLPEWVDKVPVPVVL